MKKFTLLILVFIFTINANSYTFLVNEYTKEIELEAKIISKIAKETIKEKNIKIYIPKAKENDRQIYSKYLKVVNNCSEADFIFIKYSVSKIPCINSNSKKIYFTNNYQILLEKQNFIGAFFWSKSRPNITFIKQRLDNAKLVLPKSYSQFIEDF